MDPAKPRYPIRWPVFWRFEEREHEGTHRGVTENISTERAAILIDHNLLSRQCIRLWVAIPPKYANTPGPIVEARVEILWCVLAAKLHKFRSEVRFLGLMNDGEQILENAIKGREH